MRIVFTKREVMEHLPSAYGEWSFDDTKPFDPSGVPETLPTEVALEIYERTVDRHRTSHWSNHEEHQYEWVVARSTWPTDAPVQQSGYALCIREPRGDHGLEGYSEGTLVPCQKCEGKIGGRHGKYMRVWPGDDPEATYYETIGSGRFQFYFTFVESLKG